MLWHLCDSVGANIVSTLVPNIVAMFISKYFWTCLECCVDIQTMLCAHCTNIVFWSKSQHCHNVVIMLADISQHRDNIQAMLCECCTNVVFQPKSQHYLNIDQHQETLRQCSGNVAWTLYQDWCPTLHLVVLGLEWLLHSNLNFEIICNINKHLHIGTFTPTNIHG